MEIKRLTLFAGHYGSGKTNIAINYAVYLKQMGYPVTVADLDIVNPYYRAKDSEAMLQEMGIDMIASRFANSNVDLPALPKEIYGLVNDTERYGVLDIGGDDRGALALGRYTPDILKEGAYEMLLVINRSRPLTRTAEDTAEVLREMEKAGGIRFTGIVNNTNFGLETKAEDIISSVSYAGDVSRVTGLPIKMTCAMRTLIPQLEGKIPNLFPMDLQKLYYMLNTEVANGKINF